jgi:hypothetical protein
MIFVSDLLIIKCSLTAAIPHKSEFRLWSGEYSAKHFAECEERYTRLDSIHRITTTAPKPYCKIMFENSNNKPVDLSAPSPQGLISLKEQGAIWSARRAENGEGYGFTGVI